jgi:hypothetical protein
VNSRELTKFRLNLRKISESEFTRISFVILRKLMRNIVKFCEFARIRRNPKLAALYDGDNFDGINLMDYNIIRP